MHPYALFLALAITATVAATADDRPTAAFRAEHVEVREHLAHVDTMVRSLEAGPADAQARTAKQIATALHEHVGQHAAWEEAHLYPAVDRRTLAGERPFTASMRHEHAIVGRWIAELARMAEAPTVEVAAFTRRAQRLLGLIEAHFELEEEVLLPILDAGTTREALEKELGMGDTHAHAAH